MRRAYISAAVVLIANAANGQTITAADAEQALFDPGPVEIAVLDLPFLSAEDKDVLGQIAMQQKYYGAIAFAPDDGLLSESLMGAFNYHDMTEARAAALKGCEAQRAGATPCAVVVELRPQGWEAGRALSLSGDATEAFNSQYSKAKAYYEHALNMQRSTLPEDDPEFATTFVNLAVYHDQMADFRRAESYLNQALRLREAQLGATHPLVGPVIDDLISLYLATGREKDAGEWRDSPGGEGTRSNGGDHPAIAEIYDKQASLALSTNQDLVAIEFVKEALAVRENHYGPRHDRVAATRYNLGKLYNRLGRFEQARIELTSALDIYEYQTSDQEIALSALIAELIRTDLAQGQTDLMEEHLMLLLALKQSVYGDRHPQVAGVLDELIRLYQETAQDDKAQFYQRLRTQF